MVLILVLMQILENFKTSVSVIWLLSVDCTDRVAGLHF